MKRMFVCIWIPEMLKDRIRKLQEEVRKLPIKCKMVETENLHLTLTFLGNLDENNIEKIKTVMNNLSGWKSFQVYLKGLKTIPSDNYIRVIGISTESGGNLENLIKTIGSLIGGDYHNQTKMTLCRVKDVIDKKKVKDFIEKNKNISIGSFQVKKISLVESILTESGPHYNTIYEIDLE
ncbi:MAG: RNA 2',3'-cyclic phosphodiesterase [Candidatus Aenigmatarchaeota archaeon]